MSKYTFKLSNYHAIERAEITLDGITVLSGENGSGKTTAMNIISGLYAPEEGSIYINGEEVVIKSPEDSLRLGVGMVHQHFKLVDVFTASENILLGLDKKSFKESSKNVEQRVKEMCDLYGFELDPNKKVYNMTVSEKQTLEIVKEI